MKKLCNYVLLGLLLLFITACFFESDDDKNEDDLFITQAIISEVEYDDDGSLNEYLIYDYVNEKLVKKSLYDNYGDLDDYWIYEYENDILIKESEFGKTGSLKNSEVYTYEAGNKVREEDFDEDANLEEYEIYTYNNGKRVNKKRYDSESNLVKEWFYSYNEDNLVKEEEFKNGSLKEYIVYSYDNHLLIKEEIYDDEDVLDEYLVYTYTNNNVTKIENFDSDDSLKKYTDYHYETIEVAVDEKEVDPEPQPIIKYGVEAEQEFFDLFDHSNLNDIELQFTQSNWDAFMNAYRSNLHSEEVFKANFIYKGAAGDLAMDEVGVRIRGNTTRVVPQDESGVFHRAHFKIKFRETFDLVDGTQEYEDRKDRRFFDMRSINLKWGRDQDLSQIREVYSYDLLNQAGVYAPMTAYTKLTITIDGVKHYYGVYSMIEHIDKEFLKKRFGGSGNDGNLYKCLWGSRGYNATLYTDYETEDMGVEDWTRGYKPTYDLKTNEDEADHTVLKDFISNINSLSEENFKTYIESNFDVDRFLRFLSMNQLIGMPDDYWAMGNNYYLYFHNDGKILFIPYDYDRAYGGGDWHPFNTATADIYNWPIVSGGQHKPLVEKILSIQEYKDTYESYFKEFIDENNGIFNYQSYLSSYNNAYSLFSSDLENITDENEAMNLEDSIEDYFNTRIESIKSQTN